jgi:regulator of sigma E protease
MSAPGFFWYLGAFLLALGILVVVHELGHYFAARACGVKVLRFSVGFGHPFWSRRFGDDQTEWALAAFPLGGYVKMLDEREGPVAEHELARSFNRQPVRRRAFIVAAGPIANLLLAIVLYWILFLHGVEELRPRLAAPPAGTVAAMAGVAAGSEVRAVNGVFIQTWQELRWEVLRQALDRQAIELTFGSESAVGSPASVVRLELGDLSLADMEKDPLRPLGLLLYRPKLPPVIGEVSPGSAAADAGLMDGDWVRLINGQSVTDWSAVAITARESPGLVLLFQIDRGGQLLSVEVIPRAVDENGSRIGRLGVRAKIPKDADAERFVEVQYGVFSGLGKAITQTWDTSIFSLRMMGRMLIGELSWKNLSGPVTIADYAGQSAHMGGTHYVRFLALISISLGVLNLLPIPVLDGGHLLYYLVEVIRGGPLSERVMEYGQQIGFLILGLLMAFAFYNDIHRLISG